MKHAFRLYSACITSLILSNCAHRDPVGNPLETGPFDSAGNYREDWVADPSKWSRPGSKPGGADELPLVADNDLPPPDINPLAPAVSQPKPTARSGSSRTRSQSATKPTSRATAANSRTSSQGRSRTQTAKPKPKNRSYVIKPGDSLYVIARKTGSSVAAIQRANGIKGTLIHPGKVLVIPPGKR